MEPEETLSEGTASPAQKDLVGRRRKIRNWICFALLLLLLGYLILPGMFHRGPD